MGRSGWAHGPGELVQLVGDIRPSPVLPRGLAVLGAEQGRQPQQLPKHTGASDREGAVVDMTVLRTDAVDVRRVPARITGQDRQIGVTEDLPVAVTRVRVVRLGKTDEPGDLGDGRVVDVVRRKNGLGQLGRALLVVRCPDVVHGVVEPGGQANGLDILGFVGPSRRPHRAPRAGVGRRGSCARPSRSGGPAPVPARSGRGSPAPNVSVQHLPNCSRSHDPPVGLESAP